MALFYLSELKIYLASISPRRKEILRRLGIKFRILKPKISEQKPKLNLTPQKYARYIARMKVESVKNQISDGIVIGMDTIVVLGRKILGKPKNRRAAKRMVTILSGKTHRVITGIYLLRLPDGKSVKGIEMTKVKFRKLTESEIERYIKTKEPYDKAGAYGIQGRAGLFVESINGCYFNVVGFPIAKFLRLLKQIVGDKPQRYNDDLYL